MSHRELVVLGSASQVPTRHRNHNGYLLKWDGHGLLFDPGEGIQRQMTIFGVPTGAITRICVTHFHGDHCLGLAGLCQRISLDDVGHPVFVHYPASGQAFFERLRYASIYDDRSDLRPMPISEEGVVADMPDLRVEVRRLDHRVEAFGYRMVEPDGVSLDAQALRELGLKGPLVGELKERGRVQVGGRWVALEDVSRPRIGQKAAFIMDTRFCDAAIALADGVDILVCESTYLDADRELAQKHGHMTATEAARIAAEAGAGILVLTHFSRRYPSASAFVQEAEKIHANVVAAEDGLRIQIPSRKR